MKLNACSIWALAAGLMLVAVAVAQAPKARIYNRATPKKFDAAASQQFFSDIFSELKSPRPSGGGAAAPVAVGPAAGGTVGTTGAPTSAGGSKKWGALISRQTIEDEIKAIKTRVDPEVTAPGPFAGRGYKVCRTEFSIAATLFAVIADYDDEVRWKSDAAAARDLFSRTAGNCKVGSEQAFKEAKQRAGDLGELIGGSALSGRESGQLDWSKVSDRSPLMIRIDRGMSTKLQPWTSSPADFNKNLAEIQHEAEIVALIGSVLSQDGMEDSLEVDYKGFAERMKKGAREVVEACKTKTLDQAAKGVSEINKACTDCHSGYRG